MRIVVCLDCPHYQKGGYCTKKRKEVGGLQDACPEIIEAIARGIEEDTPTVQVAPEPKPEPVKQAKTKTCPKCKRELPRSAFAAKLESKDGLQNWCRECTKEAYRKRIEARRSGKDSGRKTKLTKVCKTCGEELPISAYYLSSNGRPNSAHCIECRKKIDAKKRAERKARAQKHPEPTEEAEPTPMPTPAPVLDKGLHTVKSVRPEKPADTPDLGDIDARLMVAELRLRGYKVECRRPITVIEEL